MILSHYFFLFYIIDITLGTFTLLLRECKIKVPKEKRCNYER